MTASTRAYLCATCGTRFPPSDEPPRHCPICEDQRQYVPVSGQAWTTLDALRARHRNAWRRHEPGLMSLETVPRFAIGQRAFLVRTAEGNVLWDCLALLDEATIDLIHALGGLRAIAISHPHYYTTLSEWGRTFDCPVHLHAADRRWVVDPSPAIRFWEGDTVEIAPGVSLHRLGGHFPGGTVLHWADSVDGQGVLLTGDVVQAVQDRKAVSFMWSYPNLIPLPASSVRRIAERLEPLAFARLHNAFTGGDVAENAKDVLRRSADRYIRALDHELG
ncbi:MBL fold metallo-hydrolase [Marinivivus vitaminiproducens]|uniref:MBL fold metallo-hydrolase n=1 Tax=Marinivivus vitaminiproducens TaxID=3035935 RepID=UPI0027A92D1F|nr:MBL fold metallo-hydrolase [Geminicoccaceae bacterium SCSIO 64248]